MGGQPESGDEDSRCRDRGGRPDQARPGADVWNDVQRWFIRSSARNMRRELSGQVRKTFSGGRSDSSDVWDTATTETPTPEGEAPECQWCPICRAARRMRENPGLSGQLSGAGDAVASAVHEAIKAFDSMLARTGAYGGGRPGGEPRDPGHNGSDAQGHEEHLDGPGHEPGDRG